MNPTELIVPLFLLCGVVLIAPHLDESTAILYTTFFLGAAVVFFIILELVL